MMFFTDDPVADFERHDAEQQKLLEKLPVCYCCGEPIQQEKAVKVEGHWYCDGCLDDMREDTEYGW